MRSASTSRCFFLQQSGAAAASQPTRRAQVRRQLAACQQGSLAPWRLNSSHAFRRSHASRRPGRHTGLVASHSLCGSQGLQAAEGQRKHRQAQEEELERRAQQAGRA